MNNFILLNPDDYKEKSPTQRSLEKLHELLEAETNPERRAEIQDDLHWLAGCEGYPQPLEVDEVVLEGGGQGDPAGTGGDTAWMVFMASPQLVSVCLVFDLFGAAGGLATFLGVLRKAAGSAG